MNAMAVRADGDILVALSQKLPMPARPVGLELVHADVWIETPHVLRIGMAGAAQFRHLGLPGRSLEGLVLGQFNIVLERIAAVAVLAAQPELPMNIRREPIHRSAQALVIESLVAFQAGIFLAEERERKSEEQGERKDREEP